MRRIWAVTVLTLAAAVTEIALSIQLGHHTGMLLAAVAGTVSVLCMTLVGEKENTK